MDMWILNILKKSTPEEPRTDLDSAVNCLKSQFRCYTSSLDTTAIQSQRVIALHFYCMHATLQHEAKRATQGVREAAETTIRVNSTSFVPMPSMVDLS